MAEQDEDSAHIKRSKTLIVRHLPADLSREEKEDLLVYFGASSVRVLSDKGPLVRLHDNTSSSVHHLTLHRYYTSVSCACLLNDFTSVFRNTLLLRRSPARLQPRR